MRRDGASLIGEELMSRTHLVSYATDRFEQAAGFRRKCAGHPVHTIRP